MIREALQRTMRFVTDHNRITLLVMALLTAGVAAGIPMIDTGASSGADAGAFEDIERVQTTNYIADAYGSTDDGPERVVETVYIRDDDGNVLSKESLLAGLRYQRALRDNESVAAALTDTGTVGISNLVATRAAEGSNPTLSAQISALESASAAEVEQLVAEIVRNDPRAKRFLPADHDGSTATATDRRLLVILDPAAMAETDGVEAAIHETATERADAGFFTVGGAALEEYRSHFFGQMVELVVPLALLLILFVLAFSYRDLVDIVVGMVGVVLSILWMFGLLGWFGVGAGLVSIVPVVLVTGLSIDFGFHVFNRYREQRKGGSKGSAGKDVGIRESMRRGTVLVATALVLVTVTAAIGFLSNLVNPLGMIRDLGVSITLGVVSAFVLFLTVVPALKISVDGLLERVGFDRRKQALGHGRFLKPALARTVDLARRAAPVVVVLALVVGAAGAVTWNSLEKEQFQGSNEEVAEWKQQLPDPVGWEPHPWPGNLDHVNDVYQPATASDAFRSRILIEEDVTADDTLERIAAGVGQVREAGILLDQPGTRAVQSPLSAMEALARRDADFAEVFRAADTDGNGVPDTNIGQLYDALYAADEDLASRVVERTGGEYRSVLVTLSLGVDYTERAETVATLEDAAATMAGDSRAATVAGDLAVTDAILEALTAGILLTMLIGLTAIVIALAAAFRFMHGSATLGAVVSVPIALVVGLVVGAMYLLSIPLNLTTALLMSLVIGLGVDYNIHVGDRFADERREGKPTFEALATAVTGTGGALLGSTLTSAGAFLTLTLVPNPSLQSFGTIVVVALVTAFLVSLLVMPSALALWDRYIAAGIGSGAAGSDPVPQD